MGSEGRGKTAWQEPGQNLTRCLAADPGLYGKDQWEAVLVDMVTTV